MPPTTAETERRDESVIATCVPRPALQNCWRNPASALETEWSSAQACVAENAGWSSSPRGYASGSFHFALGLQQNRYRPRHRRSHPVVRLDLMVPDPTGDAYSIIEANERPGLANHDPQPTASRFVDFLFPETSRRPPVR